MAAEICARRSLGRRLWEARAQISRALLQIAKLVGLGAPDTESALSMRSSSWARATLANTCRPPTFAAKSGKIYGQVIDLNLCRLSASGAASEQV